MCPELNSVDAVVPSGEAILKSEACRQFIEATGNLCRRFGLPRSLGQIYGLLFLAPRALSLDEITSILQISKASVSTGTRQLASWGAIRQVWVPGDRRDYFDAVTDVASVMRQLFKDFIRPRVVASGDRFEEMVGQLDSELRHGVLTPEEHGHLAARIGALSRIQQKVKTVAPLIERLV